ncbi:cruciform cutting endonuclease Cce1 [Schizosaccharomyces cryophilus OY26]|uniref:Cruciform cutting endonuclease Cce1 n=1 Tax=Schizosaccharomyces cryophilus (strain OY26 / ATCC MYA-4695 / CBS 11777 / NBRC 106824 / NRRL Y48691) TaxID=653667 RepID=S9VWF8_SCHCR|nr:cruciform cutting endonuclease Cce1 [Schizosaccharomyces cryophilus OY26]EPY51973.1 cruciform cutting endonuclease Cce1 [Schizosaccharomyces cryophilus OY26]
MNYSKLQTLQHICKVSGLSRKGRKADMLQRIMYAPSYPTDNVLSIDLGIKNFAYCLAGRTEDAKVNIYEWAHEDLTSPTNGLGIQWTENYHPQYLARLASQIYTTITSRFHPNVILLEQQRYRSGVKTIPEWTLRVNTIESMLHSLHYNSQVQVPPESESSSSILLSLAPKSVYSYVSTLPEFVNLNKATKTKSARVKFLTSMLKNGKVFVSNDDARKTFETPVKYSSKKDDMTDAAMMAITWIEWQHKLRQYKHEIRSYVERTSQQ